MTTLNLWEAYGLRSSPFFQEELRPGDENHPVALFVGREGEIGRLARRISSEAASRSVVQGAPGVGKTSFINRLKAEVAGLGVATYEHPIRMRSGTDAMTLVSDVLRLLLRIRLASRWRSDPGGFWATTVRLLEGGEIRGGSVSAFGVGAGVSRGYVAPQLRPDSLYDHLGEALRRVAEKSPGGVLIHVDNLENRTEEDPGEAAAMLRDLRDHLMLPGGHWIFGGATGCDSVFRRFAQVDGIFPAAETLGPLGAEEMKDLLRLRYRHLSIPGKRLIAPIKPAVASRLYALYQGDLRNFLRLLADAAERGLGLGAARPMTEEEVVRHTAEEYGRAVRTRIGDGDYEHLRRIGSGIGDPPEFRVTDAARMLRITQPSATQFVDRLSKAGIIRRSRTSGRSVYYRPVGSVLIALGRVPF